MAKLRWLKPLSMWLTTIGGLNWGLVGMFNINVVTALFGAALIANIIYGGIGIAALLFILYGFKVLK